MVDKLVPHKIPREWRLMPLEDLFKTTSGGTPSRGRPEYWNGAIPWVKTGEVNYSVIEDTEEKITEIGLSKSSAKIIPKGSLLMALYGQGPTRGRIGVLGIDAAVNQACLALMPKNGAANLDYVYQRLWFDYSNIRNLSRASTQKNLNAAIVKEFEIPVPPLPEQKKIAEILSCWDKAIEQTEKLINAKTKLKKGLMQQLLIEVERQKFLTFPLSQLFAEVKEKVGAKSITPLSITAGLGYVDQREKWAREMAGASYEKYTLLRKGDFSYNKGNSKTFAYGCIYRLEKFEHGAVPFVFYSFRKSHPKVVEEFYQHYFHAGCLHRELSRRINSGVRNDGLLNLAKEQFFSIEVALPNEDFQRKWATACSQLDKQLHLLNGKGSALRRQKKGLMQQLLTGKTRVKVTS